MRRDHNAPLLSHYVFGVFSVCRVKAFGFNIYCSSISYYQMNVCRDLRLLSVLIRLWMAKMGMIVECVKHSHRPCCCRSHCEQKTAQRDYTDGPDMDKAHCWRKYSCYAKKICSNEGMHNQTTQTQRPERVVEGKSRLNRIITFEKWELSVPLFFWISSVEKRFFDLQWKQLFFVPFLALSMLFLHQ